MIFDLIQKYILRNIYQFLKKILFLYLGLLSFIIGVLGVIFPLIPGIPFFFVAFICFSKSSVLLTRGMRRLPYVGKDLAQWQDHGVIPVSAKIFGIMTILGMLAYPLIWSSWLLEVKIALGILGGIGIIYLLWFPSKIKISGDSSIK